MRLHLLMPTVFLAVVASNPQGCTTENLSLGASSSTTSTTVPGASVSNASAGRVDAPASAVAAGADLCPVLLDSAPRGLACLQCMEPGAQAQAQTLISLLRRSCLRRVALNYLADGYFGFDLQALQSQIQQLGEGGRELYIEFYLMNGPNQRRYKTTQVSSFGSNLSPEEFRVRIRTDYELQSEYQALISRLVPAMQLIASRGGYVMLVMALEDNLDDAAYKTMLELAKEAVPPSLPVYFGRNPCPGCYDGNTDTVPPGVYLEEHTARPFFSTEHGVVTNDGDDYSFVSPAAAAPGEITLDTLRRVRDAALSQSDIFILWSANRQGLTGSLNQPQTNPPFRDYRTPDVNEQSALIEFLRGD